MRNMKSQLRDQAEKTSVVQMVHPGLFKTTFRETMDSSGVVLLTPDGRIYTCCKATRYLFPSLLFIVLVSRLQDARYLLFRFPIIQSLLISSLHDKCSKCGAFFLEFDNKDKSCCYHPGRK